ncbi:hypothetical protein ACJX0J_020331, partial [Zea mays]
IEHHIQLTLSHTTYKYIIIGYIMFLISTHIVVLAFFHVTSKLIVNIEQKS